MDYEKLILNNEREWRQYLVKQLDCIEKKVVDNRIEITKLKTKAVIWGAVAGGIPVTILLLIQIINFISNHKG